MSLFKKVHVHRQFVPYYAVQPAGIDAEVAADWNPSLNDSWGADQTVRVLSCHYDVYLDACHLILFTF